jgi:hypothetical protein
MKLIKILPKLSYLLILFCCLLDDRNPCLIGSQSLARAVNCILSLLPMLISQVYSPRDKHALQEVYSYICTTKELSA